MESYSTFQLKDHYFWTDAPREERQAAKPAPKPAAQYKNWRVREADGTLTYYSAQLNSKPVIIDGYMV